jgi:four helix bundle protein
MPPQTYRDLHVWQRAMDLAAETFSVTHALHTADAAELADALARYAVAIPSRIAEWHGSDHRSDFSKHLAEAFGALKAIETVYLITDRLCLLPLEKLKRAYTLIDEVGRMLYGLRRSLQGNGRVPVTAASAEPLTTEISAESATA